MASAQGNEKEITRREFIKGSAAGGAGGLVIGAGGAALIMQSMPGPGLPGKWDHEAEVVVVGTGYAGINAAIAAHDAGAKVLVLEKAPEKFAGGNSSVSGGGMRIPLKVPETVDYYRSLCFGTVPDELCGTMVDALSSVPEQLKKLGIEVAPIRSYDFPFFRDRNTPAYTPSCPRERRAQEWAQVISFTWRSKPAWTAEKSKSCMKLRSSS